MNRKMLRAATALFLGSLTALASISCDEGDDDGMVGGKAYPPAGSTVHVQLRRDYLGYASAGAPDSRTIGAMGEGAPQPVAASGVLKRVTDEFVVVAVPNAPTRELWIPRDAVLMMDVTRQEKK